MYREENAWPVTESDTRPIGSPDACCYCKTKLGQQHTPSCPVRSRTVVIDATIRLVCHITEDRTPDEIEFGMNHSRWCAINILRDFDELAEHANGCLCDFFTGRYVREATAEDEGKYGVHVRDDDKPGR